MWRGPGMACYRGCRAWPAGLEAESALVHVCVCRCLGTGGHALVLCSPREWTGPQVASRDRGRLAVEEAIQEDP